MFWVTDYALKKSGKSDSRRVTTVRRTLKHAISNHWLKTGEQGRHHLHETLVQRAVKEAVGRAGVVKHVSCYTFRHSFATHLPEAGYDIRTIQELLGHQDVPTTMVYTHVLNRGGHGVCSPLDCR